MQENGTPDTAGTVSSVAVFLIVSPKVLRANFEKLGKLIAIMEL